MTAPRHRTESWPPLPFAVPFAVAVPAHAAPNHSGPHSKTSGRPHPTGPTRLWKRERRLCGKSCFGSSKCCNRVWGRQYLRRPANILRVYKLQERSPVHFFGGVTKQMHTGRAGKLKNAMLVNGKYGIGNGPVHLGRVYRAVGGFYTGFRRNRFGSVLH